MSRCIILISGDYVTQCHTAVIMSRCVTGIKVILMLDIILIKYVKLDHDISNEFVKADQSSQGDSVMQLKSR